MNTHLPLKPLFLVEHNNLSRYKEQPYTQRVWLIRLPDVSIQSIHQPIMEDANTASTPTTTTTVPNSNSSGNLAQAYLTLSVIAFIATTHRSNVPNGTVVPL